MYLLTHYFEEFYGLGKKKKKQTNELFHGKQKSNCRESALPYLCKVHQSWRQESAGGRSASVSRQGGKEPELLSAGRSLQHHEGIVKLH